MGVKTYSPKKVSVSVAGRDITGFAEGTFVSVSANAESFTPVVGVNSTSRVAMSDQSGTIVLTLEQTSDSNLVLTALHAADRASLNGKFPVLIKDNNGNSFHVSGTSWITKVADAEYGTDLATREWTIHCAQLVSVVGGNDN